MAEILKEWLTERLHQPIKWEPAEFGEMMKNGHIIASILLSYHVINDDKYYLIRDCNHTDYIKNNWRYLTQWLAKIGIIINDLELQNLIEGKGSSLFRLFYQMFLQLDKRDRTNFLKEERKMVSNLVEKLDHRFKIDKIEEDKDSEVDHLSKPLLDERNFIAWQKKKADKVKETYDFIRHKYCKMLGKIEELRTPVKSEPLKLKTHQSRETKDMNEFSLRYPSQFKNYSYGELLELEERANEKRKSIFDSEWTQNYMDNLYSRIHKKQDSEEFQKQMGNVLSSSMWDLAVVEEENKLDTELAKKIMKLSYFEKQICTKIMETKQQARNLVHNRIQAENEFTIQRQQQFNQFLDNVRNQIHMEVEEVDFEKRRQNMLHKKLYYEKMKRKRQHYYEICYETISSIVDYATKYAYFKRLIGDDIPAYFIREWKMLYYKKQPIFDLIEPIESLFKEQELEEEYDSKENETVKLEFGRQESLNDSEFIEYNNYQGPWTLKSLIPNFDANSVDRKNENLGMRILGHVVYTLLEIKYPYPPPRPHAALPDFSTKALLRCLPDRSITVAIQKLLNFKRIHVVRLESAIIFCLRSFKLEMVGCTDVELSFDKFLNLTSVEDNKEMVKLLKAEDDSHIKSTEAGNASAGSTALPPNTKQTQTPKTIPEEKMELSMAADLGRYVYNALSSGDSLTDNLISATIVEYLKDQQDINGFVIINYPNSYREAKILEETFSGREPPEEEEFDNPDNIYLEESIEKHIKKEKDPYINVRVSNIVKDPHKKRTEAPFESYFTCYIKLKESEDILQEFIIWDLNEENSDLLDRFYAVLGINYSMYYEVMDKDLLSQICTYIIGDYTMPLKSCSSLFGDNVLSSLDFPSNDDKRTKSKIVKAEVSSNSKSKERLRKSSKGSKSLIENDQELGKLSDTEELGNNDTILLEKIDEEEIEQSIYRHEEIKILAGEEDWDYGEIPISDIIGIALASCWEQVEKTYIGDMKKLFLAERIQMNCLIPYTRFIKDKMKQIITLPSKKQDLVSKFQKEYNNFENDWRDIHLTKHEWHCRVNELQNRLYQICDEKKLFAEQQRLALICDNWAMEELTSMANTFISLMQTELNRCILTYQILHDFYFAMIKRLPPNDRLSAKELTKISRETDDTSGSKKGGEDKTFRQLKSAFLDLQLKNMAIDNKNNPFNMAIENNVKFALKVIKETNDSYRSLISKEYSELAKTQPLVKKKDDNASEESMNLEETFKKNALKCIDEWIMGINGEMFRTNLRILALQYKCYHDMKLFNDQIYNAFQDVQNNINSFYMNEIKSVDRLCKYLQMAVENGKRIPESLLLENDSFIIDSNILQFSITEPSEEKKHDKEFLFDIDFRIGQLARLRTQFEIVARTGIILQQAFIYLLQDFVIFGKESCQGPMFPETWRHLDAEQIPKFVFNLFGETAYIDWREFLIYCLNIRFPTVEDLLEIRKKFRCYDLNSTELINREDYLKIYLWFEDDFNPQDCRAQLRKISIKHFLFELYEVDQETMNYSAFLLAFCKSVDPIEGFAMALAMAVGKKTCFVFDKCQEVVRNMIKLKEYNDAIKACAHECTEHFLDKLLSDVINYCEATTIIDLVYAEEPVEDKKGKGVGEKSKTFQVVQSAREAAQQKNMPSQSNMAQYATDVKTTFICGPCEVDADVRDKKTDEKEIVEEEHMSESAPLDHNLVYSVSQNVIWNILKICLPWHFTLLPEEEATPYVGQVKKALKALEVETDNGDIYICKFLVNPNVCKLFHKVKKFTIVYLPDEIRKIETF